MLKGVIVKSTGSWYDVKIPSGAIIPCRTVGKLRLNDRKLTNPVAVGDVVMIEMEAKGEGAVITDIDDRKNYVIRQSPRKKHYLHIIAANIDQALLIVTVREPNLKQGFIDRFLLMTEPYDIPVYIVFNKGDIYSEEDADTYFYLKEIYERIGYRCLVVSAETGDGIDDIRAIIEGKVTLFSGQSGVGKSSIINMLLPNQDLRTKDLSNYTGKGQHTTTFAEMFSYNENTSIIDSPGIKTLGFNHFEPQDVAHNFKEIFQYATSCKFDNCLHRNEPKCAVKNAVDDEEISILRYQNYLSILSEVEDQNYWERHKDY